MIQRKLPVSDQEIVLAWCVCGYSFKTVAEMYGVCSRAVRKRVWRWIDACA